MVGSLLLDFRRGGECSDEANDICGGPNTIESPPDTVSSDYFGCRVLDRRVSAERYFTSDDSPFPML